MSTSVPSPHKYREPFLDRPLEDIKTQVIAIVEQRPGIDVIRLAVACGLPIVGRRRLGVYTLKVLEQFAAEEVVKLAEPCALYPQLRVFPPHYRPKPPPRDRVYSPCRSWVDPKVCESGPSKGRRHDWRAHWDELNRQRFGEQA